MQLKDIPEKEDFKLTATTTIVNTVVEHIEAVGRTVTVKKGTITATMRDWNITVFTIPEQKYSSTHCMVGFTRFAPDKVKWVTSLKATGINLIWAFMDDYNGYYPEDLKNLMDAAATCGIPVMPGTKSGNPLVSDTVQMMVDTWDHPALFKLKGKRVYADYAHDPNGYNNIIAALPPTIKRSDYLLWSSSHYPMNEYWIDPNQWVERYISFPIDKNQVEHLYDTAINIDGLINFAVDKGGSGKYPALSNIVFENQFITEVSKAKGKLSMAGFNNEFASVQFTDYNFKGTAAIIQTLIDMPVADRPTGICETTCNDEVELSYMGPLMVPPVNGLSFIPTTDKDYFFSAACRPVITDHSGIQKFLRPWIDAFLKGDTAARFTSEKIFSWYMLHPMDAPVIPIIPPEVLALNSAANKNKFTQTWWDTTVYATGYIQVANVNQIEGIKAFFTDNIRMGAHLTSPGFLKINNTVSTLQPAGAAQFEIPLGTFRGKPVFRIINQDNTIRKTLTGLQAITDSCYPGGWNYLIT